MAEIVVGVRELKARISKYLRQVKAAAVVDSFRDYLFTRNIAVNFCGTYRHG
jgi:hypothetical protein